jgi:hypothetical protein
VASRASKEARLGRYPNRNKKPKGGDSYLTTQAPQQLKPGTSASKKAKSNRVASKTPVVPYSPSKPPKARRSPLATPEVQGAVERLRSRYTDSGRTVEEARRQTEANVRQREERLDDIAASQVQFNEGMSRIDSIGKQNQARQNTTLSSDGKTVKKFRGKGIVGTPSTKSVAEAAQEGSLRGKNRLTTPEVRQTKRQVRKARRQVRRARAAVQTPRKNLMRAGLDPEQARILTTVLKTGRKMGATKKEMLAATMTALVESNISNPTVMTDHDSLGWRQERVSQYGTENALDVRGGAKRFFEESVSDTGGTRGKGMLAGDLAQTIQGSAYPDKYEQRRPEATALLQAFRSAGSASPEAKRRFEQAKNRAENVAEKASDLGLDTSGLVTPKAANDLGLRPLDENTNPAPKAAVKSFKGMIAAAKQLEAWQLPYVWGGGHGTTRVGDPRDYGGLDCSSAVSHILQQGGVDMPTVVSGNFGSYTKPGPGAVTILFNPDHVLMKIGDKYFGTSGTNPGGGAGWIDKSVGDSEMASGEYNIGHVPGLGPKIAKQMNLDPDSYRVFPGMTVNGNTATVTSGGVVSNTPTFSDSPIVAGDGPTGRKRRQATVLGKLRELGYRVTPEGVFNTDEGRDTKTEYEKAKERVGIK